MYTHIVKIVKRTAAVLLSAALLCTGSVGASALNVSGGALEYSVSRGLTKTIDVKAGVNQTAMVKVTVKTPKKVGALLLECDGKATGMNLDSQKSKKLLTADGANVVISNDRMSVLFPCSGYDCSNGVDICELAFTGYTADSAAKGAVTFEILEFYDEGYGDLGFDALSFSVTDGSTPTHQHNIVIDKAVEATCTHEGKTEGSHCSSCGEIITPQQVIPKKEHTIVTEKAREATCISPGSTEGSYCSVCGEYITAPKAIPPKGHNFVNGVCTVCGKKEDSAQPAANGIIGDVSGDGAVTSEDALLILRHSVGLALLTGDALTLADVDGSNDVTSSDALEVLRYSLGIATTSQTGTKR